MDPEATIPPKTTSILPTANTDLPPDSPWWARYLIVKIGDGWKFLSVNVPIIVAGAVEIDQATGGKLMELMPVTWRPHLAALGLVAVAALRFVNQSKGKQP